MHKRAVTSYEYVKNFKSDIWTRNGKYMTTSKGIFVLEMDQYYLMLSKP